MKKSLLAITISIILLTGCVSKLPSTRISGLLGGAPFEMEYQKQTTIEGLMVQHNTLSNGTFILNIQKLSSVNDPQVIDKAYAGQAAVMKTALEGASEMFSKIAEGAAKGAK